MSKKRILTEEAEETQITKIKLDKKHSIKSNLKIIQILILKIKK